MGATGRKYWGTLVEVEYGTGIPTGNTKPNDPLDPDYIPPVYDTELCSTTSTTTTTTTNPHGLIYVRFSNRSSQFLSFKDISCKFQIGGGILVDLATLSMAPHYSWFYPTVYCIEDETKLKLELVSASAGKLIRVDAEYWTSSGHPIVRSVFNVAVGDIVNEEHLATPDQGPGVTSYIEVIFYDMPATTTTSTTTTTTTTTSTTTTTTTTTTQSTGQGDFKIFSGIAGDISIDEIKMVNKATGTTTTYTPTPLTASSAPFSTADLPFGIYDIIVKVTIGEEPPTGNIMMRLDNERVQGVVLSAGSREYIYSNVELSMEYLRRSVTIDIANDTVPFIYCQLVETALTTTDQYSISDTERVEETSCQLVIKAYSDSGATTAYPLTDQVLTLRLKVLVHDVLGVDPDVEVIEELQLDLNASVEQVYEELNRLKSSKTIDYSTEPDSITAHTTYTFTLLSGESYIAL